MRTSEYEVLRLKVEGDRLHYISLPSGQREATFPSIEVSDSALVFENTAHDFPQKISYRRRGADSVIAAIEGPGPNGVRRIQFPYRRATCLTVAPPAPPDTIVMSGDWSRDGRILFARGAPPAVDVYLSDANGTLRRITDAAHYNYQPRWSPDGQRLAFVSVRENRQVIFTMKPDGSELAQLTANGVQNSEPAWSPDGRQIAFRSERDGNPNIYAMNADGSNQRALTTGASAETGAAWSPDGRSILYTAVLNGRADVFIMNADGSGQRQLTQSTGHSRTAVWSPDGKSIAFSTNRDGNDEVYVMAPDGTGVRNVSNHPSADLPVAWSAAGPELLFASNRDRAGRDLYRMKLDGTGVTRVTTTR